MSTTLTDNAPLFSKFTLTHGPLSILGRTILVAEQLCNREGVYLQVATPQEFLDVNRANLDTWPPLLRVLDHRYKNLDSSNSLFLIGKNRDGEVVACQAVKLIDLRKTTLANELESLRFFYDDPSTMAWSEERYHVTALAALATNGLVAYSGGAWYRKDYRKRGLVGWLPRLARAYARGVWDCRITITFMSRTNVSKGVFPRNGYPNMEWGIDFNNDYMGSLQVAFLWIKEDEMLADLTQFLADVASPIDSGRAVAGGE